MLVVITLFGDWLYGAYVVIISIGLFALTSLTFLGCSLWLLCRKWWNGARRPDDEAQGITGAAPGG
jgi:hypothetical protein